MQPPQTRTEESTDAIIKRGVAIKIIYLLIVTTLLSMSASLGGGMVMYQRSVEALEDVVKEVSQAEVAMVGAEVYRTIDIAYQQTEMTYKYLMGIERLLNTTDRRRWREAVHWLQFSAAKTQKKHLNEVGIELVPHEEHSDKYFYHHVWHDPTVNGVPEYVQGVNSGVEVEDSWPFVSVYGLDDSGHSTGHKYIFLSPGDEMYNLKNGDAVQYSFVKFNTDPDTVDHHLATVLRPPSPWKTPDGVVYRYCQIIQVYKIPAGHPWEDYQSIVIRAGWAFDRWLEIIKDYETANEKTEVVLFDWVTEAVYAATSIHISDIVDEECVKNISDLANLRKEPTKCVLQMDETSGGIKTGWEEIRDTRRTGFFKSGSWFFQSQHIFEFRPDNESGIWIGILWLQSTDKVQSQIDEALVFLLMFVGVVLCIDVALGVVEYLLVVRPLSVIVESTLHLMSMEIALTKRTLKNTYSIVCVDEVRNLTNGLIFACSMLEEYRAYLPCTLFVPDPITIDQKSIGATTQQDLQKITTIDITDSDSTVLPPYTRTSSVSNNIRLSLSLGSAKGVMMQIERHAPISADNNYNTYQSTYAVFIATLQEVLGCTSGVLHPFLITSPDVLHVSWNLSTPCGDAAFKSCLTSGKIKTSCGGWVSCGLSNGTFVTGNIGTYTHRGFCAISDDRLRLDVASAVSRYFTAKVGPTCIAPAKLEEIVKGRVSCHAVSLCSKGSTEQPAVYYEVGPPIERVAEEWMYALAASATDVLYPILSSAVDVPLYDWRETLPVLLNGLHQEGLSEAQQSVVSWLSELVEEERSPIFTLRREVLSNN